MSIYREKLMYRDWLIGSVNVLDEDYTALLKILHDIEFVPLVKYDDDRCADGIELRKLWIDCVGYQDIDVYWGPCTVLEVILGISRRIEFEIFGRDGANYWPLWRIFWDLIDNLGLVEFYGRLSAKDVEKVHEICHIFVTRAYKRHKKGNIFVILHDNRHLSRMSLWDQMNLYIRERWPIGHFLT